MKSFTVQRLDLLSPRVSALRSWDFHFWFCGNNKLEMNCSLTWDNVSRSQHLINSKALEKTANLFEVFFLFSTENVTEYEALFIARFKLVPYGFVDKRVERTRSLHEQREKFFIIKLINGEKRFSRYKRKTIWIFLIFLSPPFSSGKLF